MQPQLCIRSPSTVIHALTRHCERAGSLIASQCITCTSPGSRAARRSSRGTLLTWCAFLIRDALPQAHSHLHSFHLHADLSMICATLTKMRIESHADRRLCGCSRLRGGACLPQAGAQACSALRQRCWESCGQRVCAATAGAPFWTVSRRRRCHTAPLTAQHKRSGYAADHVCHHMTWHGLLGGGRMGRSSLRRAGRAGRPGARAPRGRAARARLPARPVRRARSACLILFSVPDFSTYATWFPSNATSVA